ncbi:hypothetical protein MMC12_004130 [Toensbergia leucococca]|nr:hypothetical protein [Toensbergia leucococca]
MKYPLTFFGIATATLISAQSVNDLPSCSCTTGKTVITNSVTPCLVASCPASDLQDIQKIVNGICASATASSSGTISVPTSVASEAPSSTPLSSSQASSTASFNAAAASASAQSVSDALGSSYGGTNWQHANYGVSAGSRGPAFEAVSITLFIIAFLVVAFRLYARVRTQRLRQTTRAWGTDEFLAVVALILSAGVTATVIIGVHDGMGKHLAFQSANKLVATIKVIYAFTILVILSLGALKISILCLYLRMTPSETHRLAIFIMMGVVVSHNLTALFGSAFQCTPLSDYWNLEKQVAKTAHCIRILDFQIFNSAFDVLENLVIWLMPIPVIRNLKVPRERKAGLCGLVALSIIPVIASLVRLNAFIIWINSDDISWNFALIPFLSSIEVCIALVTSSVPAIYPLFRNSPAGASQHGYPKLRSSTGEDKERQSNSVQSSELPKSSSLGGTSANWPLGAPGRQDDLDVGGRGWRPSAEQWASFFSRRKR